MADPFLSEIRMGAFNFAPRGWALCDGQLLPINQNQGLFSLLGTTFGGDGRTTFALPDLRGRTPIHVGGGYTLGNRGGATSHTLTEAELPTHNHQISASSNAPGVTQPTNAFFASGGPQVYAPTPDAVMNAAGASAVGGSQSHENMPPYLVVNFIVALQGIFPSPT